jgi:hypothetical protein
MLDGCETQSLALSTNKDLLLRKKKRELPDLTRFLFKANFDFMLPAYRDFLNLIFQCKLNIIKLYVQKQEGLISFLPRCSHTWELAHAFLSFLNRGSR